MRVRALDSAGDWLFGKGQNDYKTGRDATAQNLQTRISSFLGDCFFDLTAGIDWFNLLGGKDTLSLQLAVSAVILNTQNVLSILELTSNLNSQRVLTLFYKVNTSYGVVIQTTRVSNYILTEDGDFLTTESGEKLTT